MHRIRSAALALAVLGGRGGSVLAGQTSFAPNATSSPLRAIVGTWQSDTANGVSALSACVPTPLNGGVLCEQTINTPQGVRHAQNLFVPGSDAGSYFLYVVVSPGETAAPVPFAIRGKIWIYGGLSAGARGEWHRTINDFSAQSSYSWHQETSADGVHWSSGTGGLSRRVVRRP
jgi:hypothetical protein